MGFLTDICWFDFVKDAVAEHKREMKVKEEEMERLKKGMTLPETESKVQIMQLCLKEHLYLFLMKEFKDAFFYGFHYHFKTKNVFLLQIYIERV